MTREKDILDIFKVDKELLTEEKENALMDQFAKLLARENITVIYGNFRTASFNIKDRVMKIPKWKHVPRSLKFRLRLHEMGHAIYTKVEHFHEKMVEEYGDSIAHYINVVEDDRVDRLTLIDFPGARNYVVEGSNALFQRGFFGTTNLEECKTMIFIDRLNINSKMGSSVFPMPLQNKKEAELYRRFKTTKTFEDCVSLAIEIYEYAKNHETKIKPPENQNQKPQPQDTDSDFSEESEVIVYVDNDSDNSEENESIDQENREIADLGKDSENDDESTAGDENSEGNSDSDPSSENEDSDNNSNSRDGDYDSESDQKNSVNTKPDSAEKIDDIESKTDKSYRDMEQIIEDSSSLEEEPYSYTMLKVLGSDSRNNRITAREFISAAKSRYKI